MVRHFMKHASLCLSIGFIAQGQGIANDQHTREGHENMIKFDQFHEELASRSAELLQEAKAKREAFEQKKQQFLREEISKLHSCCTLSIEGDKAMYDAKWLEFYQTTEHPDYPGKIFLEGQRFSSKGDLVNPIL